MFSEPPLMLWTKIEFICSSNCLQKRKALLSMDNLDSKSKFKNRNLNSRFKFETNPCKVCVCSNVPEIRLSKLHPSKRWSHDQQAEQVVKEENFNILNLQVQNSPKDTPSLFSL